MINPIQNIAVYLEVGVLNPQGKLQTGLVVTYTINKCSDNSLLTSGTASEIGVTGIYSFSYTFTTVAEYRLHWITPATYEDGFELISVLAPIITPSTLTAAQVWDYLLTAILTPGSIGQLLKDDIDAKISTRSVLTAQQVWDVLLTSLITPGSIGKLIVDNIDAPISTMATTGDITAAVVAINSNIDTDTADISGIKARTDLIPDHPASVESTGGQIGAI